MMVQVQKLTKTKIDTKKGEIEGEEADIVYGRLLVVEVERQNR